jgi:predicted lipoprotein with Yx(FWY)xxD motif
MITVAFLATVVSCKENNTHSSAGTGHEVPEALQDETKIISRSYEADLVSELYKELADKTPELKQLETDLEQYHKMAGKAGTDYWNYDGKSSLYYTQADNLASHITDSLLRKRIYSIIADSRAKYKEQTAGFTTLQKTIARNDTLLDDAHLSFKILATLPLIEKYQKENMPADSPFKNMVKEQERLIKQVKKLTPEH